MNLLTILVTGCGGDIGQSLGKILRSCSFVRKVFGCDLHQEHAGIFIFHDCFIVERATSPHYLKSLSAIVEQNKVDIIIPSNEYELHVLLEFGIHSIIEAKILRVNDFALETGLDKYKTSKILAKYEVPIPETFLMTESFDPKFPCIVKPRASSGGKSLYFVQSAEQFNAVKQLAQDSIYQEYIGNDNEEYTCGLFRSHLGEVRTITFKRKLGGDHSVFGIVVNNDQINNTLTKVANSLQLVGSVNVQLRLVENKPLIFEINPRFSSTVLVRHLLGFEDVIWCMQDSLQIELNEYSNVLAGSKFFKGHSEYILK